jgi:hypothetical protein
MIESDPHMIFIKHLSDIVHIVHYQIALSSRIEADLTRTWAEPYFWVDHARFYSISKDLMGFERTDLYIYGFGDFGRRGGLPRQFKPE